MNPSPMQPKCVEVFRTNIPDEAVAKDVSRMLHTLFKPHRVNIDLADCDKILRIEASSINIRDVIDAVRRLGYACEMLE